MKRSKRMSVVVDMSKREEEAAAQELQVCLLKLSEEEQKLQRLDEYYRDYEKLFASQKVGVRVESIVSNRNFLHQLAETIKVQEQQVVHLREQAEGVKRHWHLCHLKHGNLAKFVEQIKTGEIADQDKMEQKNVDEWVSQSHSRWK